jgi:hypothetical protein
VVVACGFVNSQATTKGGKVTIAQANRCFLGAVAIAGLWARSLVQIARVKSYYATNLSDDEE